MDGQLLQKKDCSAAVQAALPEAKSLAQVCVRGAACVHVCLGARGVSMGSGLGALALLQPACVGGIRPALPCLA